MTVSGDPIWVLGAAVKYEAARVLAFLGWFPSPLTPVASPPQLLSTFDQGLSEYALRSIRARKVELKASSHLEKVATQALSKLKIVFRTSNATTSNATLSSPTLPTAAIAATKTTETLTNTLYTNYEVRNSANNAVSDTLVNTIDFLNPYNQGLR